MGEADNLGRPDFEEGWKRELCELIEFKRDLFPWLRMPIAKVALRRTNRHDILTVGPSATTGEFKLVTHPRAEGMPLIIEALREIQQNTAAQIDLVRRAMSMRGALTDAQATQIATTYCVQRADLLSYRRMFAQWHRTQPAPSVRRVIEH